MKIEIEKVTPTVAKRWLDTNVENNRKLREDYVILLAHEMIEGRWRDATGETLKFNRAGKLIDGQHRLQAVVLSNLSFRFAVARNLDNDVFEVIDTGLKRNAGDTLHFAGISNYAALAAGIKTYLMLERGRMSVKQGSKNSSSITNRHILETYQSEPEFWQDAHSKAMGWYRKINHVISLSTMFGLSVYILKQTKQRDKVDAFFESLSTGQDSHMLNYVREKLIQNRLSKTTKMSGAYLTGLILKAWNTYVKTPGNKKVLYNAEEGHVTVI